MAQQAQVLAFPAPRRDAPISTFLDSAEAREAAAVTDLGAVRRQRAFDAAPPRMHDFSVDMFSILLDVLTSKQRTSVVGALRAFARYPDNRAYQLAANKLLSRMEHV